MKGSNAMGVGKVGGINFTHRPWAKGMVVTGGNPEGEG